MFCSIFGINGERCGTEKTSYRFSKSSGDLARDQHEKVLKTHHKAVI
jgi:hypothetical protein